MPGENALPFAHDDAAVIKRAGFLTRHLWVTPYEHDEIYAAGDYPNQRAEGDGLPKWTAPNRPIVDTDVVVWYTFGHTHIPRTEDWPVMPVHKIGFMLKPDGFFDSNPAMDVALSPSNESCSHTGGETCGHTGATKSGHDLLVRGAGMGRSRSAQSIVPGRK